MSAPIRADSLPPLSLPFRESDRLVVGRDNALHRLDFAHWHGSPSDRRVVVPPQSTNFPTWINQDSADVSELSDGFRLSQTVNYGGGDHLNARVRPLPSGTWDVSLGVVRGHTNKQYLISGLVLCESATGKIVTFGFAHATGGGLFTNAWNSAVEFRNTDKQTNDRWQSGWLRASKNGTNIEFKCSIDGAVWDWFNTVPITAYFTTAPDQWGAFLNANNRFGPNFPASLDIIDWSETA